MDILLCIALAPFVLAVLGLCVLAIKLDSPGPAFFFQMRTGRGGRRFKIYKLRTMVRNAEEMKKSLLHLNELTWPDFKISNDPRLTRVGKLLRRTSLDETPQLLNVLIGDMSLVGPRPTSFAASTYKRWHTVRVEAVPGITGLAQISGRCELDFDDRLRMDIAYLRNRCLWLDFQILARTFTTIFEGRGAY
jgi:lipopolysaccharide/colanic/teichoic acid biosynthesis glycosyltransferase